MKIIDDIKEKQKIAYDILDYFASFCDNNELEYRLAYGTLLGAIRHKGFIPWDDDVDVMMTRGEYNKLVSLMKHQEHPYYKFLSMQTNKNYFAPLAKMYDDRTSLIQEYGQEEPTPYGVYIDIFIVDNLPDNEQEAENYYKKSVTLRLLWGMSIRQFSSKTKKVSSRFFRIPVMILCKLVGYKKWLRLYDNYASKYYGNTRHAGIVLMGEGLKKEYHEIDMYHDYSLKEFNGRLYKCPKECDAYLTSMYGDYMTLPPVESRKVHLNRAFWKD